MTFLDCKELFLCKGENYDLNAFAKEHRSFHSHGLISGPLVTVLRDNIAGDPSPLAHDNILFPVFQESLTLLIKRGLVFNGY